MARPFKRPYEDEEFYVEVNNGKSITIPDQSMTVAQIVEYSLVSGELPYLNHYPEIYDPDYLDDEEWFISPFEGDLTDIDISKDMRDYEEAKKRIEMDSKGSTVDNPIGTATQEQERGSVAD